MEQPMAVSVLGEAELSVICAGINVGYLQDIFVSQRRRAVDKVYRHERFEGWSRRNKFVTDIQDNSRLSALTLLTFFKSGCIVEGLV
jgi:hypothetical protein